MSPTPEPESQALAILAPLLETIADEANNRLGAIHLNADWIASSVEDHGAALREIHRSARVLRVIGEGLDLLLRGGPSCVRRLAELSEASANLLRLQADSEGQYLRHEWKATGDIHAPAPRLATLLLVLAGFLASRGLPRGTTVSMVSSGKPSSFRVSFARPDDGTTEDNEGVLATIAAKVGWAVERSPGRLDLVEHGISDS